MVGGRGGSEKNENNAILNSVEVVVEVGVELGKKYHVTNIRKQLSVIKYHITSIGK